MSGNTKRYNFPTDENKKPLKSLVIIRFLGVLKLSDLGSNQDSSPPKGDVLPVTPSDNFSRCYFKKERKDKNYYN